MAKQKINERTDEALHAELDHNKKRMSSVLRENDSLRADRMMLLEMLSDLTETESYWADDVATKTTVWRLKNLLNNLKNS
jgi:hypothetical protein